MTDNKTILIPAVSVGDAIRVYRESAGLSMKQLSEKTNLCPAQVSHIERGITRNPGIMTVKRILKPLNCRLVIIYDRANDE